MKMKLVKSGETAAAGSDAAEATDQNLIRIGDIAKKYNITLRTLRFYEDKGLISPKRDGSTRLYSRREEARLKLILLGRKVGFSLRDVKQMLDLYDPTGTNTKQLRLTLEKSEKQLQRLTRQRQAIDEAINELTGSMSVVRELLDTRPMPVAANG